MNTSNQQNAVVVKLRDALQMGLLAKDAQPGKLNEQNGVFFKTKKDEWLFSTSSVKQAEMVSKAIETNPNAPQKPAANLIGVSFTDGNDRIDIKAVKDEEYIVKRVEDHPFLKDKKSIREEQWNAEDLHASLAAGLLKTVQTYTYTSNQFPYELPEMELRNKGLVDIQRTDNGSLLTFDRPVSRAALGLDSLSPTPETESKMQKGKENERNPQMTKADDIFNTIKGDNQNTKKENTASQKELSPMLKQFYDLKSKHPDALLLFRCGDFYETYQQDAQKASFVLGITLTRSNNRNTPDGKPMEMAGFPHHALDTNLPKLIRAGLRVAICDQLEDPKLSQKDKQKTVEQKAEPNAALNRNPVNPSTQNSEPQQTALPQNTKDPSQQTQTPNELDNLLTNKEIIDKIDNFINKNKGMAIIGKPSLITKTAKGVDFGIERIVREDSGKLRVFGFDDEKKERSVSIDKVNKEPLLQILNRLSSRQTIFINSQENITAKNKKEENNTPLSEKMKNMIAEISDIIGDKRGTGISPEKPIMVTTASGEAFPVETILKDKQGNLRLADIRITGREKSVAIEKVDEQIVSNIVSLLHNSNIKIKDEQNKDGHFYGVDTPQEVTDSIGLYFQLIDRMEQAGVDRFKFDPIKVKIDDPTQNIYKNVDIIKVVTVDDMGVKSLKMVDSKFDSYDLLNSIDNKKELLKLMQEVTDIFNRNYGDRLSVEPNAKQEQTAQQPPSPPLADDNTVQNDNMHRQTGDPRQDNKLLTTERVHDSAKENYPDYMVFIRLRNPETKKYMFQTFGEDAERLQKLSPSTNIDVIDIKGKSHFVASLQQDEMDSVRNDLKTNNVTPIFFNAKGSLIDNKDNKVEEKSISNEIKPSDNIQFDVHRNSHVSGIYDIRLYVNGDKAGAHHLSKEDRNAWLKRQVPIRTLMHKYFPQLKDVNLENLTLYEEDKTQKTEVKGAAQQNPASEQMGDNQQSQKPTTPKEGQTEVRPTPQHGSTSPSAPDSKNVTMPEPKTDSQEAKVEPTKAEPVQKDTKELTQKERVYAERADKHQEITDQLKLFDKQPIVLLQLNTKEGPEFYQTFNKDADFIADFLERKLLRSGDNRYISINSSELKYLKDRLGEQNFLVEKFIHNNADSLKQRQTAANIPIQEANTTVEQQKPAKSTTVDITPNSRVEYTISPYMRYNKNTQQQETVAGMKQLSVSVDGVPLVSKILSKEDRDLLNARPGEITNIINKNFQQELNGGTVNFRQVHKPAVTDDKWRNLTTANGLTFDEVPKMDRLTNAEDGRKYHVLTAQVNGMRLGPKQMFHEDINDYYDHAKPAVEIAARVFREELRNIGIDNTRQQSELQDAKKERYDQVLDVVMKAKQENPGKSIIIERSGGIGNSGVYYQMFGDDAKNMAKVANRSLKIMDTNRRVNMEYYSMTPDQKDFVMDKMRIAGFLPVVIDQKGNVIGSGKKEMVIDAMTTDSGRRFEQMSIKQTEGKWMLNGIVDGVKMPAREVSKEDAYLYMNGKKSIDNILEKYYERKQDGSSQKQEENQQPKMRR